VVSHAFQYRDITSGLTIDQPRELFLKGGRYEFHRTRTASYGTYSAKAGIVSIICKECPRDFLGLGAIRIFFRQKHRLFMTDLPGTTVVELIDVARG
jgi:hypothetical protein